MQKLKFILPRAIFVLVCTGLALAVAFYLTRDASVSYSARVKMLIDQPASIGTSAGLVNITKAQQLIPTYAQIIMSTSTADRVAEISPDISPAEAQGSLASFPVEKTQVLVIEAKNVDPRKSIVIANNAAQSLIERVNAWQVGQEKPEDRLALSVVESAEYATPVPSPRKKTLMLAGIAALIITTGGVFVFENARRG
ncbi:MAG: hypothetical protein HZB44_07140 [Actinobacteria bacterium]|nr:hypothetical protein [Actinomycetota bacterium]